MRTLFNDNWTFLEMPVGTGLEEAGKAEKAGSFLPVRIPHDWLIGDSRDLYRDGTGWYRKVFSVRKKEGKRTFLIFDGIYMDSAVYLNGAKIGEWKYGYTRFSLELTGHLQDGDNELMVSVTFQNPNSRWYSGAGINRNVWLLETEEVCIPDGGIYTHAEKAGDGGWNLRVETRVLGPSEETGAEPEIRLYDDGEREILPTEVTEEKPLAALHLPAGDRTGGQGTGKMQDRKDREETSLCRILHFGPDAGIRAWDIEEPNRYRLEVRLNRRTGETLQTENLRIGFRETAFDPDHGFFLNGRHVKLNGACQHPDQGALGTGFRPDALRRQFEIQKKMGVNAIRLAHNPFAAETLELADEMGLLIMDEAFDMWERSKTQFDYARFFDDWQARDVESFVCRDRNHPSVILWSIGNEIYDQHADERGYEVSKLLMEEVRALDPCENGHVTTGSNYMPWENAQHCADLYKIAGYNYSEKYYEEHHRKHPDWVIYGSETSSICASRGIYHFPLKAGILADEDEQCSALGNSVTSWGAKSMEDCVSVDRDLEFSMGQFLWTGFDYIGEPTPYHTKNSYLGVIDTAGFPKDAFYVWQSAWTDVKKNPMVHVFPYWDFNEGQEIDLRVCSNAEEVELLVNGTSLGRQKLDHAPHSGRHLIADWHVTYVPGEITAVAYENGQEVARQTRHSFGDTERFVIREEQYGARQASDREENPEDTSCGRLHFYEISAVDADGYPVENASDRVRVEVKGGRLLGLDNGDSTDYDSYQASERNLFSGKLLAIVEENPVRKPDGSTSENAEGESSCAGVENGSGAGIELTVTRADKVPVRKVTLHAEEGQTFDPEHKVLKARAEIAPKNADDQEVVFSAVDDNGVATNIVKLEQSGAEVVMTALGDGTFHLRATSKSGTDHVRIISQLEYRVEGMGPAYLDPYGFISGSLYTGVIGEVGNGNEKGVATSRDGETTVTWSGMDFGPVGSDEITIPIFALSGDEYPLEIWEGVPGEEGANLLAKEVYCKPCIWNVYQPETYHLAHRLKGLATLSIRVHQKIHIKGFSFRKLEKAWTKLFASESDGVYGDSFRMDGTAVREIGNNVSLLFKDMEFASHPLHGIRICGSTPLPGNTIHVRFYDGTTEEKEIIEFSRDGGKVQEFPLKERTGKWDLTFVFLPGSRFDFEWFELF